MMEFDHPNILHLIGVCFNTPDSLPAIILPYMANGDLRTFLRAKKNQHDMSKGPKADYPEVCADSPIKNHRFIHFFNHTGSVKDHLT